MCSHAERGNSVSTHSITSPNGVVRRGIHRHKRDAEEYSPISGTAISSMLYGVARREHHREHADHQHGDPPVARVVFHA